MEMGEDARFGLAGDGDGAGALLAEFSTWLSRERGLSPVTVRCYVKQSRAFLAALPGRQARRCASWTRGRSSRSWWPTAGTVIPGRRRRW
jgi:hypothetical protein